MPTLSAITRTIIGKQVKTLRHSGSVPAVIYGHDRQPGMLTIDGASFDKVYRQVGESTLVDLVVDGGSPVKVLVQDVQLDPSTSRVKHIDFHQLRMDEMVEVDIKLKFVGEAPAVKGLGGVLVKAVPELKVKCLPVDLVHEIEVDISILKEFDIDIKVSDITLPKGITVLSPSMNEVVVTVTAPRSEAELAALKTDATAAAGDVSQVEAVKQKPAEEGEAASAPDKGVKAEKKSKE